MELLPKWALVGRAKILLRSPITGLETEGITAPREPRPVEHPDPMSGKAPRHCLELGEMDPQGRSPAELVLGPQQPREPGSLWVNGQCPSPAGPVLSVPPWPLPSPVVLLPDHGWVSGPGMRVHGGRGSPGASLSA